MKKRRASGSSGGARSRCRVPPGKLRKVCSQAVFEFSSTKELRPLRGVLGQKRALRALEFGLGIRKRGYNILVVGQPGCGKTSIVRRVLEKRTKREAVSQDICYVFNFDDPPRPRVLFLPPGRATELAEDMERLVKELRRQIPKILSDRTLAHRRAEMITAHRMAMDAAMDRLLAGARKQGLEVRREDARVVVLPLVDGEPLSEEEFEQLPDEARRRIEERVLALKQRLDSFERQRSRRERQLVDRIQDLERKAIDPLVGALLAELKSRHRRDGPGVLEYLEDVEAYILRNYNRFTSGEEQEEGQAAESPSEGEEGVEGGEQVPFDLDSREILVPELYVNVLVNRAREQGAPFIYEQNPTPQDLVGYLEYREVRGGLKTDHTLIRPGALHRAHGGYLVLQALDLLRRPAAFEALKQVLDHGIVKIEDSGEDGQHRLAGTVTPEPAAVNVKVILVGMSEAFQALASMEPEFGRLFKVRVDFEDYLPRTKGNVRALARFVAKVCAEEGYRPLDRNAMSRLVEFAARQAEHQDRLTARLSAVVDLVAEADFWARRYRHTIIQAADVERALAERRFRSAKYEDAFLEDIRRGQLLVTTKGTSVGCINGIAVYDVGDYSFGVPTRITARTYAGTGGVVHIDREVQLTGAIHNKGALILVGFLGGRFADRMPLALSASITFEQNYEEIEGDSASAAELFALLSSLADLPVRQGIAVTGSVNQKGEIQPVGGVNEKVEGVYRIAKLQGLDGHQGVILPRPNLRNLMLSEEVVEAVRRGQFHIWAISTVDEGIEILTGVPAGVRRSDGSWEPDTVNGRVAAKLEEFARVSRHYRDSSS